MPASSSRALRDLRVEAVQVRDAGGNEMRLYLSAPAILQGLGFLLRLAPTAANVHRCDVRDSDLNLRVGFDLQGFGGGLRLDLLPILSNPQVEATFRAHRHHKADVERAPRGRQISGEPAHGPERPRSRNCNRRALSGQYRPFAGGRLQAAPESSLFVDSGLSIRDLLIGSVNV